MSCTIAAVDQPSGSEPISSSYAGDVYDTTASATGTLYGDGADDADGERHQR